MMNPLTGKTLSVQEWIKQFIETSKLAEDVEIDVFNVGGSHQTYFVSQAHTVILGAIAQATKKLKLQVLQQF